MTFVTIKFPEYMIVVHFIQLNSPIVAKVNRDREIYSAWGTKMRQTVFAGTVVGLSIAGLSKAE